MRSLWRSLPVVLTILGMYTAIFAPILPTSLFDYYTRGNGTKRRRNRFTNVHQTFTPVGWKNDAEFVKWQEEQSEPVRRLFASLEVVSPQKQWSPLILNNPSDWNFYVESQCIRVEYYATDSDTKKRVCLFSGQQEFQPTHIYPQQRASFTRPNQLPDSVSALPHGADVEVDVTVFVPNATNFRTGQTVYFNPPASRIIQMGLTRN